MVHALDAPNLFDVYRPAAVGEARAARRNRKPAKLRQGRGDILDDAVDETAEAGVLTSIHERKNGNGGSTRRERCSGAPRRERIVVVQRVRRLLTEVLLTSSGTDEPIAPPPYSPDQPLLLAVVPDRASNGGHSATERGIGDNPTVPNSHDQIVLAKGFATVPDRKLQEIENQRLHGDEISSAPQFSLTFAWAYWLKPTEQHASLSLAAAQKAVALDRSDALAHAVLGDVLIYAGKPDEGEAELATALRLNPNQADAWAFLGQLKAFEGSAVEGIDYLTKALRLNPYPPGWYHWLLGLAQYAARRYEDAVGTLRHEATYRMGSQRILAASLAQLGRMEEAKVEAREFLASNPQFSTQHWSSTQPFRREVDRQHFLEGYLKAGLPS